MSGFRKENLESQIDCINKIAYDNIPMQFPNYSRNFINNLSMIHLLLYEKYLTRYMPTLSDRVRCVAPILLFLCTFELKLGSRKIKSTRITRKKLQIFPSCSNLLSLGFTFHCFSLFEWRIYPCGTFLLVLRQTYLLTLQECQNPQEPVGITKCQTKNKIKQEKHAGTCAAF